MAERIAPPELQDDSGYNQLTTDAMKSDRSIRRVLAGNVRRLRELRGWHVEVLARRLRMDVSAVAAIEKGSSPGIRIGVVEAIARVFEVPVAELLTSVERRRKPPSARRGRKGIARSLSD